MEKRRRSELERLGRNAAAAVVGEAAIKDVDVAAGQDSTNDPAYWFTFRLSGDVSGREGVTKHVRISQRIRDDLLSRNDDHYPYIQLLDLEDGPTRT